MEFNLKEGMEFKVEIIVEQKHTAQALGSGGVQVLATPMMIALMEGAALKSVDDDLPEGYTTVGTHLNVSHIGATPLGMNAYALARLVKIEGKKLTFDVEAFDEKEKIGEGTHERFIIQRDRFMDKVNSKGQK